MKEMRRYGKEFYDEIKKDNVYKMGGQYVITGKGDKWNAAKNEIEELYLSWIQSCNEIGLEEHIILERLESSELCKEDDNNEIKYFFSDNDGIVGMPFILGNMNFEENKTDLLLLLLYISSKLQDSAKNRVRDFVKLEYAS